jgi:hypothetical protein
MCMQLTKFVRLICGTKKKRERIKVSRHKDYDYFVNVIDVAHDIKQSVLLIINFPFSISVYI